MKAITFNCPACDFPLTVPASAASETGPCPECGEEITGPGLDPDEDSEANEPLPPNEPDDQPTPDDEPPADDHAQVDEAPEPDDEIPDPDDEAPEPVDETPDPVDETPDPVDEIPDPVDEAPEPDDEAPEPDDETPDPDDETPDPDDEAPEPDDEAPDPVDEIPDPVDEAPEPDDEEPQQPEAEESSANVPAAALPARAAEPSPNASTPRRGVGVGMVMALCVLSSLTCLGIGYQLGRKATPPQPPQPAAPESPAPTPVTKTTPPVDPKPVEVKPAPAPSPAPAPDVPPEPANTQTASPRRTALNTFLAAPDWSSRTKLVLHADHVREQMESLATDRGDGPVASTRISPLHETEETAVFKVFTRNHPNGFPIALNLVDGRWLVDWTGFAEFRYDLFRSFLTKPAETTGTFRLLIKPELADVGDTGRQPYAASTPDKSKPTIIYAAEGSPVHETLDDMIGALASRAPTSFRKLMNEGGIPLVLSLRKSTEQEPPVLVIDQIVAHGWSPLDPDPEVR